jgi:threonine dehydrogenase-like Zn-dependent dehydrogenase
VDLTRVISDTFPMADLKKAYETALAGPAGKVVLTAE